MVGSAIFSARSVRGLNLARGDRASVTLTQKRSLSSLGANFVFSIYDFDGSGSVDAVNLGDMLRALNLNPTLVSVEKVGGTKKKSK